MFGPKSCGRPTWRRHGVQLQWCPAGRRRPVQKVANCKLASHGLQPERGCPVQSVARQTRLRMANLALFGVQPGRGCSVRKVANSRLGTPRPPVGEGVIGPKSCERQIWHPLFSSCGGDARPQTLLTANLPPWASSQVAHARPKALHGKLGALPGGCSVYSVANSKFGSLAGANFAPFRGDARSKKLRTASLASPWPPAREARPKTLRTANLATSLRPAREGGPGPKSCELQTCDPWPPAREGRPAQSKKPRTANPVANGKLGALWRPAGEGVLGPKSCERQTPAASSWRGDARPKELRTTNLAPFSF